MANEQTIDAIMDAVLASQDSAFRRGDGLEGYEESVAADQHVRDLITAALAAKNAEIAALKADAERYRWLRLQHWSTGPLCVVKSPKNAVKLGHDCPSRQLLDGAIDAEISEPAKPASPSPGEWIEWNGGECPIADGVGFQFKFRDDSQNKEYVHYNAPDWNWNDCAADDDIIAYRIIP